MNAADGGRRWSPRAAHGLPPSIPTAWLVAQDATRQHSDAGLGIHANKRLDASCGTSPALEHDSGCRDE